MQPVLIFLLDESIYKDANFFVPERWYSKPDMYVVR